MGSVLTGLAPALMALLLIYCAVKTVGDFRAGRTISGVVGLVATLFTALLAAYIAWFVLMISSMSAGPY